MAGREEGRMKLAMGQRLGRGLRPQPRATPLLLGLVAAQSRMLLEARGVLAMRQRLGRGLRLRPRATL